MLPSNSEKQSINDVRQREGCLAATARLEDKLASAVCWSKICIHRESFAFNAESNFNCNVHQYSLDGNISAESFPFLPEIFFVKDCIEKITRFVAAVKIIFRGK